MASTVPHCAAYLYHSIVRSAYVANPGHVKALSRHVLVWRDTVALVEWRDAVALEEFSLTIHHAPWSGFVLLPLLDVFSLLQRREFQFCPVNLFRLQFVHPLCAPSISLPPSLPLLSLYHWSVTHSIIDLLRSTVSRKSWKQRRADLRCAAV